MKTATALLAGLFLATSAPAAVLIMTGTDAGGKAYVTLPSMTFTITTAASAAGFNSLEFDIVDVWGTVGSFPPISGSGSGLTYIDSGHPGIFSIASWVGHSLAFNSSSDYDSALMAVANTSYTYTPGEVITLAGGTFTLNTANAAFPVFSTGSYSIYFAGLGSGGGILSSEGVAVPEPSTFALVALGALGVIVLRRKRLAALALALACAGIAQAQKVQPVGIVVSNLSPNALGNPVDPLSSRTGDMAYFANTSLTPGTVASFFLELPEGTTAQAGLPGGDSPAFRLVSMTDSTGKDLMKLPEGAPAPNPHQPNSKPILLRANEAATKFLIVTHGPRCPAPGAIGVKGEIEVDTRAGKMTDAKSQATNLNIGDRGEILDGTISLAKWEVLTADHFPDGYGPKSKNPPGPKAYVTFQPFAPGVMGATVLDNKGNVVAKSPAPAEGITIAFVRVPGAAPYTLVLSHAESGNGTNTLKVPFELSLGVGE